jgi:hypothetical protein
MKIKTIIIALILSFLSLNAYSEISITCEPHLDQNNYKFNLILDESSKEVMFHGGPFGITRIA